MKKTLTCLLILLVASSLTITFTPNVYAQTSNVRILDNYSFYEDSLGNLVVIGEVQNVGSSVIGNVTLTGTVTSDSVTAQGNCAAWGYNLLPGQKAPFYMEFYPESSGTSWTSVTKSDITLEVYNAPETTQYMYQGVQVVSSQATPTATGEYWVTAQIQNNGTQTAQGVWAFATFFNAQGEAVGSGYIDRISSIAPGATTTIKVPCWDLNQTIVDSSHKITAYSILIQVASPLQSGVNIPVVSNNPTPIPAGTTAVSNGNQTTTGTDQTTNIILVAIVTVALIAVAAVLIVNKRKKAQTEAFQPAEHTKTTRRERKNQ
jgi:LPXTG-motif cell wall-anchored protein